jgi:hypothetical protein
VLTPAGRAKFYQTTGLAQGTSAGGSEPITQETVDALRQKLEKMRELQNQQSQEANLLVDGGDITAGRAMIKKEERTRSLIVDSGGLINEVDVKSALVEAQKKYNAQQDKINSMEEGFRQKYGDNWTMKDVFSIGDSLPGLRYQMATEDLAALAAPIQEAQAKVDRWSEDNQKLLERLGE